MRIPRLASLFLSPLLLIACDGPQVTAPSADAPVPVPGTSLLVPVTHDLAAGAEQDQGAQLLSSALLASSGEVVLDFEVLASSATGAVLIPAPYQEDGYSIDISDAPEDPPGRLGTLGTGHPSYAGSPSLFVNDIRGIDAILTRDDGAPFAATSIELAPFFPPVFNQPAVVTFTGTRTDGTTVTQTETTGVSLVFEEFELIGFGNLVELRWTQNFPEIHQFDNIVLRDANPTVRTECFDGGWAAFGFRNQGQCVRFVETGGDSR